jgi:hypothetical protein
MPTLKGHRHTAKLIPIDLSPIDYEKRHAAMAGIVPCEPATYDSFVPDFQSVLAVRAMFCGQGPADFFDQSP